MLNTMCVFHLDTEPGHKQPRVHVHRDPLAEEPLMATGLTGKSARTQPEPKHFRAREISKKKQKQRLFGLR